MNTKLLLAALLAAAFPALAIAQSSGNNGPIGGGVAVSGTVTAGHCASFVSQGKIQDAGANCGGSFTGVTTTGSPANGQAAQFSGTGTITGVGVTGTGNFVLSTSPTLTTPSLGAALAASINASFIPNAAGTLTGSGGSFTLDDCIEVLSTAPLELGDAGAPCGSGGGGMTWPSGSSGVIAVYGGSNNWIASYSSSNPIPANFISTLNQSTTGNAATATALAAAPSLCSSGQAAQGVLASGNATGCASYAAIAAANTWSALQTFGLNISIGGVTPSGVTGTGNLVFATSPTFVTPALGTPASGVATNLTGTASALNIGGTAANLSGTPALPNGTTGTTQSVADNTTKLATDAFVLANAGSITGANNTIALNNSGSSGALTPGTPQAAIGVLNSASANAQTGTTYTFVIGDANGEVTMSNASSNAATIPPNSSVAFPVGTLLTVQEVSTGVTSVGPGAGVTITSAAYGSSTSQTYSLGGVYGFIQLQQTATNTWTVVSWDTPVGQQIRALAISSEMQAYLAASTQFTYTPTGCTPSAATGGPFSGKITLASGPCTSILITMNGATGFTDTNGYDCTVADKTLQAAGTWFGRWGVSADTTTTATIPIPSAAGATDIISFTCTPRSL